MNYPTDVCLVGASGLVGHELLLVLAQLNQVKAIKVVTRSPLGRLPAKSENLILNFDKMSEHSETLKANVYVCCLGTTIATAGSQEAFRKVDYDYVMEFARIAEKNGAQKFLVISSIGANPQASAFYTRVKGEMERDLRKLHIPQIEIFRPSLLLGERKEHRSGEKLAQRLSPILNPLLVGPLKKYRAIKATDVARAMGSAVLNFNPGLYIYESDEIHRIANPE
ncbi:MAG: oxidoreductase [Bdellovibrio sp.]|nr:oxidoreductase [Bdellovibrio sp.]